MKSRKNRDSERKERGRAMSLKKERCVGVCGCGWVCVRACMRACVRACCQRGRLSSRLLYLWFEVYI